MLSDNDCDVRSIEDDERSTDEDEDHEKDSVKEEINENNTPTRTKLTKRAKLSKTLEQQNNKKNKEKRTPSNINCEICGKKFLKQSRLDEHLRQHQGLKVSSTEKLQIFFSFVCIFQSDMSPVFCSFRRVCVKYAVKNSPKPVTLLCICDVFMKMNASKQHLHATKKVAKNRTTSKRR